MANVDRTSVVLTCYELAVDDFGFFLSGLCDPVIGAVVE